MTKLTQRWTGRLSILVAAAVLLTGSIAGLNKWKLAANAKSAPAKTLNPQQDPIAEAKAKATAKSSLNKLPLAFEANHGQTDARVKYLSRAAGYTVFLTEKEVVFSMKGASDTMTAMRMEFEGGQAATKIEPVEQLPGKSNYMVGERANWRKDVPHFAKVRYQNIYPGIDALYQGSAHQFRYDFVVKPGADAKAIRMNFAGAEKVSMTKEGDLTLEIGGQKIVNKKPYLYQEIGGEKKEIAGSFTIAGNKVGFEVADYDHSKALVIDPVVVFASYLGGNETDAVIAVAVNATNNLTANGIYVTGLTTSLVFPTTVGVYRATPIGLQDAYVAKLNLGGNILNWSTYLGGTNNDGGNAIAVDADGRATAAGTTFSTNFGGLTNAAGPGGGTNDAWVVRLNPTGTAIELGLYIGGNSNDFGTGVALDNNGVAPYNTFIGGYTDSVNFPVTAGTANNGSSDAFIAKILPGGTTVSVLRTYGGTGAEIARGIAILQPNALNATGVTNVNDVYIVGDTTGGNFASNDNTVLSGGTGRDPYVIRVNNSDLVANYTSFLFGNSAIPTANTATLDDTLNAVAVDPFGRAILAGQTLSAGLPTTGGAFQPALSAAGSYDCWLARITPFSSANYVTFFGAAGSNENCLAVGTDSSGQIYTAGSSANTSGAANTLPTTGAAVLAAPGILLNPPVSGGLGVGGFTTTANTTIAAGETDAFFARLNPNAVGTVPVIPQLNISHFFYGAPGSAGLDVFNGLAVTVDRTTVLGGQSFSVVSVATGAPTYQTVLKGTSDGTIAEQSINDIIVSPDGLPNLSGSLNTGIVFDYATTDGTTPTNNSPVANCPTSGPQVGTCTFVVSFTNATLPFTLPVAQGEITYSGNSGANQWLNLPTQDITPGVVRVSINTAVAAALVESFVAGSYTATFNVTAAGSDNGAAPIKITLNKRPNTTEPVSSLTYTYNVNTGTFTGGIQSRSDVLTLNEFGVNANISVTAAYAGATPAGVQWLQMNKSTGTTLGFRDLNGTAVVATGNPGANTLNFRVCTNNNCPGNASDNANASVLAPGIYTAVVTKSVARSKNGPFTINVTLTVVNSAQQIQLTPNSTPTLYQGQVQQIFATVANPDIANPAPYSILTPDQVAWSLTGFAGGGCIPNAQNPALGTLSNLGPSASATYTAPNPIAAASQVTITACRPSVSAVFPTPNPTLATLIVNLAPAPSLAPAGPVTLYSSQTQQFVTNNAPGSTVAYGIVAGSQTGSAIGASGAIGTTSGIYVAPAGITLPGTLQVQGTITGPGGSIVTAPVTINLSAPSSLTFTPSSVSLYQAQTQVFTAVVSNSTATATFSLSGPGALSNVTATTVTYTAPTPINSPQTATVTATVNSADGTRSLSANINLVPLGNVACTPGTIYGAQTSACIAQTINPPVWSVLSGGGSINASTGVYTAPAAPAAPVTVTVQAADGTTLRTGTITVLPASAITIVPALTSLYANGQFLFAASIVNANGVQPTWTVSAGPGTISSTGLYTAPATVATATTATITATLATTDGPRTATATVNLQANPSMTPATANLYANQSQQFTATAAAAGFSLTYSASEGTINPTTGLYTAPPTVTTQHAATITANYTSVLGSAVATTTSTVNLYPPSTLAISPTSTSLKSNQTQAFSCVTSSLVPGTPACTFAVLNPTPLTGTVNATTGLYTAPGSVTAPLAVTVRATLAALDGTRTADAIVNLVPPAGLTMTPVSASLYASQTVILTANSTPTAGFTDTITWTVTGAGTVSPTTGVTATYTAPATVLTAQAVTVTATAFNSADGTRTATAAIALVPPASVSIAPATSGPLYPPGTALPSSDTFTATVLNSLTTPTVTWSLSGPGSLSTTTGTTTVYTAPAAPGVTATAVITATATTSDPSGPKTATATVTVLPQVGVSITPRPAANIFAGQQQQFSAAVTNTSNTAVTFSASGGGTISSTGLYSAPALCTLVSQLTVTVRATSVFDTTKSSAVTFQVAPACTGTLDFSKYVKRLYIDFLGRVPDAAGNTFWVNRLASIPPIETSAQVGQDFFNSPEFHLTGLTVANAYVGLLGRDPDYAGFTFWLNSIRGGQTQTALFNTFVNSPEFIATYGNTTDMQYIQLLYLNTLQRPATDGDLAFWVPQVATQGRATIAGIFITSDEFNIRFRTRQLSNLLYLGFLGRTPDPLGRTFWTNELNQGISELTVIGNFVDSLEYRNRVGLTTLP